MNHIRDSQSSRKSEGHPPSTSASASGAPFVADGQVFLGICWGVSPLLRTGASWLPSDGKSCTPFSIGRDV